MMSEIFTIMKFEFLPNEMLMHFFEFLNASDIFHSFDQLNYRFSKLILIFGDEKLNLFITFTLFIFRSRESD
jgi:hypothetical protein